MSLLRRWWRTASTAFWLGWKIESNWADPVLFLGYSLGRPLAGSLIIVFMYFAVAGGDRGPLLPYVVVGTAFWPLVLNGVQGITRSALEDREHYRTVRELYTAPISYRTYLLGRASAQALSVGGPAVLVTMIVGWLALDVRIDMGAQDVGLLLAASALGLAALLAVGLFAAATVISVASHAWQLPDALAAALFLVTGTLFPVGVLPGPLQAVSDALPLTWWLECVRRALLGDGALLSYPWASDARALATLAALTLAWGTAATAWYGLADRRARRLGILDVATGY